MSGLLSKQVAISDVELEQIKREIIEPLSFQSFARIHYGAPYWQLPFCKQWHDSNMKAELFWFRNKPFKKERKP